MLLTCLACAPWHPPGSESFRDSDSGNRLNLPRRGRTLNSPGSPPHRRCKEPGDRARSGPSPAGGESATGAHRSQCLATSSRLPPSIPTTQYSIDRLTEPSRVYSPCRDLCPPLSVARVLQPPRQPQTPSLPGRHAQTRQPCKRTGRVCLPTNQ